MSVLSFTISETNFAAFLAANATSKTTKTQKTNNFMNFWLICVGLLRLSEVRAKPCWVFYTGRAYDIIIFKFQEGANPSCPPLLTPMPKLLPSGRLCVSQFGDTCQWLNVNQEPRPKRVKFNGLCPDCSSRAHLLLLGRCASLIG